MEYKRDNFLKLRELVNSGQLDETRLRKAQDYIRGYLTLNPQDAQSDLETVQRAQGKPVAAPQGPDTAALDFQTPRAREAAPEPTGAPAYPPDYAQNIAQEQGMHPSTGGPTPAEQQHAQVRQAAEQFNANAYDAFAQQKDDSLPSASGVKGFYRPPEYVAPKKTVLGLPANAPVYYSDPTLYDFKKAMQPMFPGGTDAFTDDSMAFKAWKDAQYANAYDKAKAANVGIVRIDHARGDRWDKLTQKAAGAVDAFVPSAVESATLGLTNLIPGGERNQLAEEAQPGAATAGGVAGMFTPGNLAERGFAGSAKLINKIPGVRQLETRMLGRLGMAGIKGAVGAVGVGGVEDATRAVASAIATKNPNELLPTAETAKRAGTRALIGAGIGMPAELIASGAQHATESLGNPTKFTAQGGDVARDVTRVREAGGKFGLTGIAPSPAMKRQVERGLAANARPEEMAADELLPSLVTEAGQAQSKVVKAAGARKQEAIRAIESIGNPKAVPWDAIDSVIERASKGLDESGNPLPGVTVKAEGQFLNQALKGRPRPMPRDAAEKYVTKHPESRVYDVDALRAAGLKDLPEGDPNTVMVVTGKPVGARQASEWYDMLQEAQGGPKDAASYRANLSVREPTSALRTFIAKKFTALSDALNVSHGELSSMEARHAAAGLPKRIAEETQTIQRKVGRSPESPEVLRNALPRFGMDESSAEAFARAAERDLQKAPPAAKIQTRTTYKLDPFSELPRFRGTLTSTKEPKTEEVLSHLSGAAKELPAYRALDALLASRRLQGAADVHPYLTAGAHGPRIGGVGKWSALRLRTDETMKAIAQLPSEEQSNLVGWVKNVHQSVADRLGPSLKELEAKAEKATGEIEHLSDRGYVTRLTAAEQKASAEQAAAARSEAEKAGLGEDKTVPALQVGGHGESGRTPGDIAAERDARVKALLADVQAINKQFVRRAARPLGNGLRPPVRSIRGGRPGRAGGAFGNEPKDLTPEEMRLLMLILDAQPAEQPKKVASK